MRSLITYLTTAILPAFAILAVTAVDAHHSYIPKYNPKQKLTLTGTIESVRYQNPHIFFEIRVGSTGTIWQIETESIPKARAKGLMESSLALSKKVTVTGWQSRQGTAELGLSSIRLPNGRTITIRRTPR